MRPGEYTSGRVLMGEPVPLTAGQRASDVAWEGNALCAQQGHGLQARVPDEKPSRAPGRHDLCAYMLMKTEH